MGNNTVFAIQNVIKIFWATNYALDEPMLYWLIPFVEER